MNIESRLQKSAKRHYWDTVFSTLAEADGDDVQYPSKGPADNVDYGKGSGVPTIHIRKLKAFLQEEKSLKVRPQDKSKIVWIMLKDSPNRRKFGHSYQ